MTAALDLAREGTPVLVESLTYRQGPHTTSDDPERYEDRAAFLDWRISDPIERFEAFLRESSIVGNEFVESIRVDAASEFEAAREEAGGAERDPDDVFDHVYENAPSLLERQREELWDWLAGCGEPYE